MESFSHTTIVTKNDLSKFVISLIEHAPVGVVIHVENLEDSITGLQYNVVWFDEWSDNS